MQHHHQAVFVAEAPRVASVPWLLPQEHEKHSSKAVHKAVFARSAYVAHISEARCPVTDGLAHCNKAPDAKSLVIAGGVSDSGSS